MRGKDITAGTKMLILLDLADVVSDAKPKHGSFNVVAKRHGVGGTVVAALGKAKSRDSRERLLYVVSMHGAGYAPRR